MKYLKLLLVSLLSIISYSNNQSLYFHIRFKQGGKCLDIRDNNYITSACRKENSQTWRIGFNMDDNTYTLISNLDNQAMTVSEKLIINSEKIKDETQRFIIQMSEDCKFYTIKNKNSQECVTPVNPNKDGSSIKEMPCNEKSYIYFQNPLEVNTYPIKGECNNDNQKEPNYKEEKVGRKPAPDSIPTDEPQVPSAKPVPSRKPQGPSAKPVPSRKPQGPSAKPVPSRKPQAPSAKPVPSRKPQGPSAKPVPSRKPQAPSAKSVPSRKPQGPSAKPVPSRKPQAPSAKQVPSRKQGPLAKPVPLRKPQGQSGVPAQRKQGPLAKPVPLRKQAGANPENHNKKKRQVRN